ncbi:hypothetical protein E2562_012001 [Oryza meyeriana var. granulata]|uniref:Integrase catalytic domain-containing protein n=1 Tax=Oryza meyeriana var. granulata TaxID=110450 RepID=A0A6G1F711_9ORYZ|nr:hypothetical protein E2562_012001 [Oryza meyeriana var. granulata]
MDSDHWISRLMAAKRQYSLQRAQNHHHATAMSHSHLVADRYGYDDVEPEDERYKSEHLHPAGLLLPLPVPQGVWTDIALDFVEALPRVRGKSVILTVVDRFSKYCHFIPLAHPYSAESVAQAFFTEIVRLHGMPQSMVSDRDPVFTSTFWRELMRLMGTKLHMTTAFHPQSDGQSEAANPLILILVRKKGREGGGELHVVESPYFHN